jgi:uncharacterized protein YbaR (Trm112 family)
VFIELIDVLRCPNAHEDSWLVLAAGRTNGRDIIDGTLGCPVCRAEYAIVNGVVRFTDEPRARAEPPDEGEAFRLAALLDLTGGRGYAVLVGETGNQAPRVRELTDMQLMLVNPPDGVAMGGGVSGLTSAPGTLPLAAGSARAIALHRAASPALLAASLDALAPGGRLLAPVALPLPAKLSELARDERHWLAERRQTGVSGGGGGGGGGSSGIVPISRRR